MRTRWAVAGLALLAVAAGLAGAHGWAVVAGPQVVGDGTVVVDELSTLEEGYLAVHVVEDGQPGRVVGHVAVDAHEEAAGVEVALDEDYWAAVDGTVHLVAAVHESDGDGEFDWPDGDPLFRARDDPVADRFAARKADGSSARVVATRQETDGTVTLRRADLHRDGFVVLYADEDGERGDVVGVAHLPAGNHEDVSVAVDPRFYNEQDSRLYLMAAVHADDGDGTFEPEVDSPVRVDGAVVSTRFDAEKTRSTLPTPEPTATATERPVTPTSTPGTASPTSSPPPTTGGTATAAGTATEPGAPGFGPLVALVALATLVGAWGLGRP